MFTIFVESIKNKVISLLVTSSINMNNNLSIWIYFFHCLITSFGKSGILFHIIASTSHWPKETICCFVSYLNPFNINTIFFQKRQYVLCMFRKCVFHFIITHVLPCCWNMLLTWICPPITIVEIYHHSHTIVFCTFCHF